MKYDGFLDNFYSRIIDVIKNLVFKIQCFTKCKSTDFSNPVLVRYLAEQQPKKQDY